MRSSFTGLYIGLAFAIALVYFLLVVNFQSWSEAFIIITALPGALAGICWILFLTHTPLSVPALMGAIMCIGVATANSVLVITFANERFAETKDAFRSSLEAGATRLRPVIMTATAMIIGMVPMALGLGEGGEQNAPLGRAVIGGLLFATLATLFFVPTVFTIVRSRATGHKVIRRNPMSHEDVLNRSQEHASTPSFAVPVCEIRPTGKSHRLLWFMAIPVVLAVLGLFTWFSKSRHSACARGQHAGFCRRACERAASADGRSKR